MSATRNWIYLTQYNCVSIFQRHIARLTLLTMDVGISVYGAQCRGDETQRVRGNEMSSVMDLRDQDDDG